MNYTARIRMLALAIAVCFLGATVALAFPRGGDRNVHVAAYFPKAIGLFSHSKVRVLGVTVGTVTRVRPEGTKVRVDMTLDPERKIPASARAVIVPISLIADRYIQLTPVYSSGPVLKDGDVIDVDRTSIPVELDDVLAQMKKLLDAVEAGTVQNPQSIGLAVKNLASALAGAGEDLSKTLGGAGKLSSAITDNAEQLDAAIGQLSRLLAALAQRRGEITTLNSRLAQALSAIASEHTTLNSALENIALMTDQLGSLVKEHRPALTYDLGVLARTTGAVIDNQKSLQRSLDWLHVLADGADDAHNGGAVHITGTDQPHIDVRDAHIDFPCVPPVPPTACLLLAITGNASLLSALSPPAAPSAPGENAGASAVPASPQGPRAPDPTSLLDILPGVTLPAGRPLAPAPAPSPTSGLRGLFDRLGGLVDTGVRWFW